MTSSMSPRDPGSTYASSTTAPLPPTELVPPTSVPLSDAIHIPSGSPVALSYTPPARSTQSAEWSVHNLFAIADSTGVLIYLPNGFDGMPSCRLSPQQHPALHLPYDTNHPFRQDYFFPPVKRKMIQFDIPLEYIHSIRWSPKLVGDGSVYPSASRLAVYTTSKGSVETLFVYVLDRMSGGRTRWDDDSGGSKGRVRASRGVAIDLNAGRWTRFCRQMKETSRVKEETSDGIEFKKESEELEEVRGSKRSAAKRTKPPPRRVKPEHQESPPDSGSEDELLPPQGVKSQDDAKLEAKEEVEIVHSNLPSWATSSLINYFWMPILSTPSTDPKKVKVFFEEEDNAGPLDEALLVVTYSGIHWIPFSVYADSTELDRSEEVVENANSLRRPLPPPIYNFAEKDTFLSDFTPAAAVLVKESAEGTHADVSTAPKGTAATEDIPHLLLILSPLLARVMAIRPSTSASATPLAHLQAVFHIPQLTIPPSALFATMQSMAFPSVHHVQLRLLIAVPGTVFRGSVEISTHVEKALSPPTLPGMVSAAMLTRPPSSFHFLPWSIQLESPLGLLGGSDVFIRGFTSQALDHFFLAPSQKRQLANGRPQLIMGVAHQCLYGFLLEHQLAAPVLLFQCGRFHASEEAMLSRFPSHTVAGIGAVAFHPSASMAFMIAEHVHPGYPPLVLLPLSANNVSEWYGHWVNIVMALPERSQQQKEAPLLKVDRRATTSKDQQHTQEQGLCRTGGSSGVEDTSTASPENVYTVVDPFALGLVWAAQSSMSYYLWETSLFRSPGSRFALQPYAEAWQTFFVDRPSPFFKYLLKMHQKEASPPSFPLFSRASTVLPWIHEYFAKRQRYGVELFLRHPQPVDRTSDVSPTVWRDVSIAPLIKHSAWWELLIALCRLCPKELIEVLRYELLAAHAICIVSCRSGFAGQTLPDGLRFLEDEEESGDAARADAAVGSPQVRSVRGALTYLHLYRQFSASLLAAAESKGPSNEEGVGSSRGDGEEGSSIPTASSALSTSAVLDAWTSGLSDWLVALDHFLAEATPEKLRLQVVRDPLMTDTGTAVPSLERFPCSVCAIPRSASFTLPLSTTNFCTENLPVTPIADPSVQLGCRINEEKEGMHTSVFSPVTFCSVPLFSSEYVITRCVSCAWYHYATSSFCSLCGGFLL